MGEDWTCRDREHLLGLAEECRERTRSNERGNEESGVRLLAGVLTAAKNWRARQAIRETWGSHPGIHRWALIPPKALSQASCYWGSRYLLATLRPSRCMSPPRNFLDAVSLLFAPSGKQWPHFLIMRECGSESARSSGTSACHHRASRQYVKGHICPPASLPVVPSLTGLKSLLCPVCLSSWVLCLMIEKAHVVV